MIALLSILSSAQKVIRHMNLKVLPITNGQRHMIEKGLPIISMPLPLLWGTTSLPDNCYCLGRTAWIIYKGKSYMYPSGHIAFKLRLSTLDRQPLRDCVLHAIEELIKEGYASKNQKAMFFHDMQRRRQWVTRQETLRFRPNRKKANP